MATSSLQIAVSSLKQNLALVIPVLTSTSYASCEFNIFKVVGGSIVLSSGGILPPCYGSQQFIYQSNGYGGVATYSYYGTTYKQAMIAGGI